MNVRDLVLGIYAWGIFISISQGEWAGLLFLIAYPPVSAGALRLHAWLQSKHQADRRR